MHIETWTIIGVVAAAFTSFGFVPQVRKMWRRRSARDVSQVTFIQMMVGYTLWLTYGLFRHDVIIVAANCIAMSVLIVGIALYYRFREKQARAAGVAALADAPAVKDRATTDE